MIEPETTVREGIQIGLWWVLVLALTVTANGWAGNPEGKLDPTKGAWLIAGAVLLGFAGGCFALNSHARWETAFVIPAVGAVVVLFGAIGYWELAGWTEPGSPACSQDPPDCEHVLAISAVIVGAGAYVVLALPFLAGHLCRRLFTRNL